MPDLRSIIKTLLISEIFPPRTGGSGRWFWEIYRRLPRERFVVAVGEHPDQEAFDRGHDLNLFRLPLTLSAWGLRSWQALAGYARAYRRLAALVRSERIDTLHCGRMLPEGWLAWLLQRRYGISYSVYIHGEEANYGILSRELGWMMRRVLAGADRLIANSRNTARILTDQWQAPAGKICVLHPGTDIDKFAPAPRDAEVRARLEWDARPVVLTVGRLQRRKGHDMFLRAMPAILQQFPDLLYAIVGEGEERPRLEAAIRELGLESSVQFRGELDDARLVECYRQSDLFVLPNREFDGDIEGFGIVLLEAQACGKPVVAGRSGGTAETMRVGETGLVVPCDEPGELAQAVIALLADRPRCEQMGEAGRAWTAEHFGWEALVLQAAELFGCGDAFAPNSNGDDCLARQSVPVR